MSTPQESPEELLNRLNQCLAKFKATQISELTDCYSFHPDLASSKLGSGSYGEAYRVKSVKDPNEPLRVVKVIPKARVTRTALQIQHLCAELAVTGILNHQNLNHRAGLYHNRTHIFLLLELCEGPKVDLQTRLAHLLAMHRPARIGEIPTLIAQWTKEAGDSGYDEVEQYVERSGKLRNLMAEIGAKKEIPVGGDLFNMIVAMKRFPDAMSAVILKQCLVALAHMHESNIVHRDIKTENVVLSVERSSELIRNPDSKEVEGVRIHERVNCKLIDFGLVKYMNLGQFPSTMSPGFFERATQPATGGATAGPEPGQNIDVFKQQQGAGGAMDFGGGGGGGAMDFTGGRQTSDPDAAPATKPAAHPTTATQASTASNITQNPFPLSVTPCGTELYCSLEVIDGILSSGVGRSKWTSSTEDLPKLDVYGIGTAMFCMANGRPPFRPPQQYRQVSREEKIRQIQRLIHAGPVFGSHVSEAAQDICRVLMTNDPKARPTAAQALAHPFFSGVGTEFTTEARVDGIVTHSVVTPTPTTTASAQAGAAVQEKSHSSEIMPSAPPPTTDGATASPNDSPNSQRVDEDDNDVEEGHEDDVIALIRGAEDAGDAAGKQKADDPAEK